MSTRPPPPSGRPPAYAFAGRAFGRTDLRSAVIAFSLATIVWSLVWSGGAFSDISGDKQNNELKKLVGFDIVLGALYASVAAIEFFGLIAAIMRRSSLVRVSVGLSWLAAVIVFASELVRTVVHFSFKNAIIDECTTESTGDRVRSSFGFWGGTTHTLSADEAHQFCEDYWSRNTLSTLAWLVIATLLAILFASVTHSYYRQLLDPTFARAPSDQVRLAALRAPHGGGNVPYPGFNTQAPTYAPPPGVPPPWFGAGVPPYEGARLPGYGSEFAPKDVEDEKGGSDGNPFGDPKQHLGVGPSEAEFERPDHHTRGGNEV